MGDEEVFEIKRVDPKQPFFVSTIKLPEDILTQLEQGQFSEDDLSITFTKDGKGSFSLGDQSISFKREVTRKDGRTQVFCLAHDYDTQSFDEVGPVTNKLTVERNESNVRALIRNQTINTEMKRKERQVMVSNQPVKKDTPSHSHTGNGIGDKKSSVLKRRLPEKTATPKSNSPSTMSKTTVTPSSSSSLATATTTSTNSSTTTALSISPPSKQSHSHNGNATSSSSSLITSSKPTTKTKPTSASTTPNPFSKASTTISSAPPSVSSSHSYNSVPAVSNLTSPPASQITSPPSRGSPTRAPAIHRTSSLPSITSEAKAPEKVSNTRPPTSAPSTSSSGIKMVNGKIIVANAAPPSDASKTSGKRPRSPSNSAASSVPAKLPAPSSSTRSTRSSSSTNAVAHHPSSSSQQHLHSYDTSESTLCKLKPEIANKAQYDQYTQEFNSKYGKYTQMAEELNAYNKQVAELGVKYAAEKNEERKKEIAQEIKNFYEKNNKQYHHKEASYRKLHQELKAVKFRIKQYAEKSAAQSL